MSQAVERVREALTASGHPDTIVRFPQGTHTAQEAASAIGVTLASIAKCIVFRSGSAAVLAVVSGINRVDKRKLAALLDRRIERADPAWILATTGFDVGGVSPVGLLTTPIVLIDRDLVDLDPVWAAAGSPSHVFRTSAASLIRLTGGATADIKV